jgi:hypothetical protein
MENITYWMSVIERRTNKGIGTQGYAKKKIKLPKAVQED